MAFAFTSDGSGRSKIIITDEPTYVVPLQIAPLSLEDELKHGDWLVISMSVWSADDIRAGHQAVELTKRRSGRFKIGLRPYDYPEEYATWLPGIATNEGQDHSQVFLVNDPCTHHILIRGDSAKSPVWVVFCEGKVMAVTYGCLTDQEIENLVLPHISTSP